jgi:hypothetical protein
MHSSTRYIGEIIGYQWPAGTFFLINVRTMLELFSNNSNNYWEELDKFDLDRWMVKILSKNHSFIMFGGD